MYNIRPTTKFQKDLKRVKKRGFDISLLTDIIKKLAAGEPLPEKNREHQLSGDYTGCRECHITPDWLLIYEVDGDELPCKAHTRDGPARRAEHGTGCCRRPGCALCRTAVLVPDGAFDRLCDARAVQRACVGKVGKTRSARARVPRPCRIRVS